MKLQNKFLKVFFTGVLMCILMLGSASSTAFAAFTWTESQPAGAVNKSWRALASDADGSNLVAGESRLYTSSDGGANWTERQPAGAIDRAWAVASDDDGSNLIAGASDFSGTRRLYTSSDGGANWTQRQPAGAVDLRWITVASDADGSHLVAAVSQGRLYTSNDSGASWTERQPAGDTNKQWESVVSDADGSNLVATHSGIPGGLYTSSDGGANWTERQPDGTAASWRVASDDDGSNIIVARRPGRIHTSSDGGANWTERQPIGNTNGEWSSVASDSDGSNLIVGATLLGRVYTSDDGGVTWAQEQPAGGSGQSNWNAVASDADGSHVMATISNGRLYVGVPDIIAPTVSSFSPADNSIEVSLDATFDIVFDEDIATSTGDIVLYDAFDDSVVETIDIAGGQVTLSDTDTLTVDPMGDLDVNTDYYFLVDAGSIEDLSGNAFAGIADPTTWNFTSDAPPVVDSLSPGDDSIDVGRHNDNGEFSITFDQGIVAGIGNITLHKTSDDSLIETFDVTDGGVVGVFEATATIVSTEILDPETEYYFLIDAGAFEDGTSNPFAGISDETVWSFTTISAPTIESLSPEDNAIDIPLVPEYYYLGFDQSLIVGTGDITLHLASDDSIVETFDVTNEDAVSFDGSDIYLYPEVNLDPATAYYILIDAGAIDSFDGIADPTTWSFTTIGAPTIVSFQPENDATGVSTAPSFSIGFNQQVDISTGNITLHLASDDSIIETFDVTDGDAVEVDGSDVYITSAIVLELGTEYYFLIDAGALVGFAGISDPTTWSFTTGNGPAILSTDPADNATGISRQFLDNDGAYIEFDRSVSAASGNITLYKTSDDSVIETWDVAEDIWIEGGYVYLSGSETLEYETGYHFLIDAGAFEDEDEIPFAGITNETTWNFTTRSVPGPADLDFERVSVNDEGEEGDSSSEHASISADGRYVAFSSYASNLVEGDENDDSDIFVYDRNTDTVERVSVNDEGEEGDSSSKHASISADGRYVAFESSATNLVEGDENENYDIFVYDRNTDTVERVSVNDEGEEGDSSSGHASISADGRYVAFSSYASNLVEGDENDDSDIFVYDRNTDTVERVSVNDEGEEGDSSSEHASISADGRYVAFQSYASSLVGGDENGDRDIFVYDRNTDTVERVSVNDEGEEGDSSSEHASISADGRYVAFESSATNLVEGDENENYDIFVYDRTLDSIERIGDDIEYSYNPSISANGRYVAFVRSTDGGDGNTEGVFRYDRQEDELLFVTEGALLDEEFASYSDAPVLSEDGIILAFSSDADNLVTGDTNGETDVFVYEEVEEEPEEEDEEPSSGGGGSSGGSSSTHRRSSGGGSSSPSVTPPSTGGSADTATLLATLRSLLRQLLALGGTLPPGAEQYLTDTPAFTRNLTIGDTGSDVQQLQIFLNTQGFTLAVAGPGSPENETTLFGALTQSALAAFQQSQGITPAVGYFGPITRAVVNGMM